MNKSTLIVKTAFESAQSVLDAFINNQENLTTVERAARMMADAIEAGNKLMSCGNGGSMCDAMHFAEELTGRFRGDRRALPAIAIADPSHITCTANDFGFDAIFSRYVEGVGQKGDALLAISTSGNSPNIIKAVEVAKQKGISTIGLLGKDGGKLKTMVDLPIVVPAGTSDRVQEIHIKVIHIFIESIEAMLKVD